MTKSIKQPPQKADPEPPMEEHGYKHTTGPDELKKKESPAGDKTPEEPDGEQEEEQHDAGHGDIHQVNEVWK